MKDFCRKVIANLIIIMLVLADFMPIGLGLVSYAEEQEIIEYSVKFVEITEETEKQEEKIETQEQTEEVPLEEGTSSDVYFKEDSSLLGVEEESPRQAVVEDEEELPDETEREAEEELPQEAKIEIEETTNNEENLVLGPAIEIKIKLNYAGYLKNGKIEVKNYESQLFKIRNDAPLDKNIYLITENKIKLNQINSDKEYVIYIPISIEEQETIDMEKLQEGTTFNLVATCVNSYGYEEIVTISKNAVLQIENDYSINMDVFVEKFIPYVEEEKEKALVQVKVVGAKTGTQVLPAKKTYYEVELPNIEEVSISDVSVFALSSAYTNGLCDNEVQFSAENWEYVDGKVKITVENNPLDGMYNKSTGADELIITFIYEGLSDIEGRNLTSKAIMKSEIFTSNGMIEKAIQEDYSFDITEASKSIITYEVSGKTKEISKGYFFGNLNSETEDSPVEYENSLNVNISRVELLKKIIISETDEYYEDEYGRKYPTRIDNETDSFYKQVKINKANLDNILGDNGSLELTTEDDETLIVINKDTPEDGDGFVRISFGDCVVDKLNFIINNPQDDGILTISATKNIFKTRFDKTQLLYFKAIVAEYSAKAVLDLDIETDMGSTNTITLLKDTQTDARLTLNKEEISTLVKNEDVELAIALNNADDSSDMYSNPIFEIVFPEEIKSVELKDFNLLYGNDELAIKNVETLNNDEGLFVLKISLAGRQTKYTNADSSDGTKIIIKTDISTDLYQATEIGKIRMYYCNEDATSYNFIDEWNMTSSISQDSILAQNGFTENTLKIVAPEGIVNVQSLSNYNGDRSVKSVDQGYKEDYIETFANKYIAKNTIVSINNSDKDVEGYKLLGRTTFEGNKSIITGEVLGTNINAPMTSFINIVRPAGNSFAIYYSQNGEATEDLDDPNNGWVQTVEDVRAIKSYLIVAQYPVKKGDSYIFEYEFEIPEYLNSQVNICSTFATCNIEENNIVWSEADKVMLTTGEAPVLNVETYSDLELETATEGQRITYTTKITNEGNVAAKNVEITNEVPEGTTLVRDGVLDRETREFVYEIAEIRPGDTVYKTFEVEVNNMTTVYETVVIEPESYVHADGLEDYLKANVKTKANVAKAEIALDVESNKLDEVIGENELITYYLKISNVDVLDVKDCYITVDIPEGLEVLNAYEETYYGEKVNIDNNATFDQTSGKLRWHIDKLDFYNILKIEAKTRFIENATQEIPISYKLESNSLKATYYSNEYKKTIGKPILETKVYANNNGMFIKEGDSIQFVLNMKNVGGIDATNLDIQSQIPKEYTVTNVSYMQDGYPETSLAIQNAEVKLDLAKEKETQIVVNCMANSLLNKENEKLTEIGWSINGANIQEAQTEKIQTVIEQNPNVPENAYEDVVVSTVDTNIPEKKYEVVLNEEEVVQETKTYKILGRAFEDLNKNGEFEAQEEPLENVVVKLCDAKTQELIKQTVTNKAGEYVFEDLEKGDYYIKYEFDNDYYGVTSYKKSGIRENKNSDAIISNGRAVTDRIRIKDSSISDVNIGLIKIGTFDLEINAEVNRIVLINENNSHSYNPEDSKMAKFELYTKNLENIAGAVEYDIKITNKGEIPGYAKQVKANLYDKLALEENLNPVWYSGIDGEIYSNTLADTIINPGETQTIKLYLYKEKNELGLFTNSFEITKDYNEYAIEDTNINNNKSSADYILKKAKGVSVLLYSVMLSLVASIMLVSMYMAKYFMETSTAKEYGEIKDIEKVEDEEDDDDDDDDDDDE